MPARSQTVSGHHGRLSQAQQWRLVVAAMARRGQTSRLDGDNAAPGALQALDLDAIAHVAPPGDDLAQAAWRAAAQLQPEWLTQHVLRTFAWGSLFALNAGLQHNRSLLFAACVLHDLGLTTHAAEPREHCFALRGARAAHSLLCAAGASRVQAGLAARAITRHLDLEVPASQGAEAHLLHAGAGLDVLGRRRREIPLALTQAVIARHPRLQMKQALCLCMRCEAEQAPDTRAGVMVRKLGFLRLIEQAPFSE
jgi:hypothetical protein